MDLTARPPAISAPARRHPSATIRNPPFASTSSVWATITINSITNVRPVALNTSPPPPLVVHVAFICTHVHGHAPAHQSLFAPASAPSFAMAYSESEFGTPSFSRSHRAQPSRALASSVNMSHRHSLSAGSSCLHCVGNESFSISPSPLTCAGPKTEQPATGKGFVA